MFDTSPPPHHRHTQRTRDISLRVSILCEYICFTLQNEPIKPSRQPNYSVVVLRDHLVSLLAAWCCSDLPRVTSIIRPFSVLDWRLSIKKNSDTSLFAPSGIGGAFCHLWNVFSLSVSRDFIDSTLVFLWDCFLLTCFAAVCYSETLKNDYNWVCTFFFKAILLGRK